MAELKKDVLKEIDNLIKKFDMTRKAFRLYPPDNPIPSDCLEKFYRDLSLYFKSRDKFCLEVTKDKLFFESIGISGTLFDKLAFELKLKDLSALCFLEDVTKDEIKHLMLILNLDEDELRARGGIEILLWSEDIKNIQVKIATFNLRPTVKDSGDEKLSKHVEIDLSEVNLVDEVLWGAPATQKEVQRLLFKLLKNPSTMAEYLLGLGKKGIIDYESVGLDSQASLIYENVDKISEIISSQLLDERSALLRQLAETILTFDKPIKAELVRQFAVGSKKNGESFKILSELTSTELASILFDCVSYYRDIGSEIENILEVLPVDNNRRFEIRQLLSLKLEESSLPFSVLSSKKEAKRDAKPAQDLPTASVTQNIVSFISDFTEEERLKLQAVCQELNDDKRINDNIYTFLNLLYLEDKPEKILNIMGIFEDILPRLVLESKFDLISESLEALNEKAKKSKDAPPKAQVNKIISKLVENEKIEKVIERIKNLDRESPERKKSIAYLVVLGEPAISVLLDRLAVEEEMIVRKTICDILPYISMSTLGLLGSKVHSQHWYLVRNIVGVLGMMRSEKAVVYLKKSVEHEDWRVRAETARALGLIKGPRAFSLLLTALNDKDKRVVRVAIENLGTVGRERAVPYLVNIINRGFFFGDFDLKREAIKSLGLTNSFEAIPYLQKLSKKKALFHRKEAKEVRTLALNAIQEIERGNKPDAE